MVNADLIYGIDDVPPPAQTVVLGLQHYLTMFGSTVAIPLILSGPLGLKDKPGELGLLIGTMFFISGGTTLLQTTFGNRLPIVQGGTFSFLGSLKNGPLVNLGHVRSCAGQTTKFYEGICFNGIFKSRSIS